MNGSGISEERREMPDQRSQKLQPIPDTPGAPREVGQENPPPSTHETP